MEQSQDKDELKRFKKLDLENASLEDLDNYYKSLLKTKYEIEELLVEKNAYYSEMSITDEYLSPILDSSIGTTLLYTSYHTDVGRIITVSLRGLIVIFIGSFMYTFGLEINSLVQYWRSLLATEDADYGTPVVVLCFILIILNLLNAVISELSSNKIFESDNERRNLYRLNYQNKHPILTTEDIQ